jgi:hypothetical protein
LSIEQQGHGVVAFGRVRVASPGQVIGDRWSNNKEEELEKREESGSTHGRRFVAGGWLPFALCACLLSRQLVVAVQHLVHTWRARWELIYPLPT